MVLAAVRKDGNTLCRPILKADKEVVSLRWQQWLSPTRGLPPQGGQGGGARCGDELWSFLSVHLLVRADKEVVSLR